MKTIRERLADIVSAHLGVDPSKVVDPARFVEDLGANSIDTLELAMAIEEEFGCAIPNEVAGEILTVRDAVVFVEQNAIAKPSSPRGRR